MESLVILLILLVLSCLVIALYGSRKEWASRRCPFCRVYVSVQATVCWRCTRDLPPRTMQVAVPVLVVGILLAGTTQAQFLTPPACQRLSFFAEEDCVEAPPLPAPLPPPPAPTPLFTKEIVSPYTAPELLALSNDRTMANARHYVRRQIERNTATEEVTRLVQQAWDEVGRPHVP